MTDTPIVTVAQTGNVQEIEFSEGMTVGDALSKSGIELGSSMQLRLNGAAHDDMDEVLSAGDQILVVGAIRGAS